MKLYITIFLFVLLSGCALGPENQSRFSTSVNIFEYNSVSSKFTQKPTHGSISDYKGNINYNLSARRYGGGYLSVFIPKEHVGTYLSAIEKYLEWNEQAIKSNHRIEKKITEISYYGTKMRVTFYSGNEKNHYMIIDNCPPGIIEICTFMAAFDYLNVNALKAELTEFDNGNLSLQSHEDLYN